MFWRMSSLTLDWIQLAAAVGALQGVLLTVALLAHRTNHTATRLLAALAASFTIYLASSVYYASGLVRVYPHFFGVSYQMPWVFGPLVYLYALAASDRSWRFTRRTLVHFVPVAISVCLAAPYYIMSGPEKVAMYDRWVAGNVPTGLTIIDPLKYVSGIAYSAATVLYLRRHRRRIEHSYSNTARVNLSWLLRLAAAAGVIWLMASTLRLTGVSTRLRDGHVTLAIAVLVYAIGYMGLRQPEIFRYDSDSEIPAPPASESTVVPSPIEPDASSVRYERSTLGDIEAERLKRSLLSVMDTERPWQDCELTLPELAARLDTTPHKLSEVLNAQMGQTFYDFVNGYRVREVQRRIKAGEPRTRKMLALALDAGFASKSTFNQVFKKHTNYTPSDFWKLSDAG
jgi:AraC-like DNA-binding protein